MTKIIAIVKAFNGEELIEASLESIKDSVARIMIALPERDWKGRQGNTVAPVIDDILKRQGIAKKTTVFRNVATHNHQEVYEFLQARAREKKPDLLMLADADEVWDFAQLQAAIRYALGTDATVDVWCARMYSYLKSPFFRTKDFDPNIPPVFIRPDAPYTGSRWSGAQKRQAVIPDVFFHHFSAVRRSLSAVLEKFSLSNAAENMRDIHRDWVETIWNRLPKAVNANPNPGLEVLWPEIVEVGPNDLPAAMQEHPLTLAFQKYRFNQEAMRDLPPELLKRWSLPVGFGPGHPKFNTPSFRNRYKLAREEMV
jgi:hypothetical protein